MTCYAPVRIVALLATGLMLSSVPSGGLRAQTADDEYMRGFMATAYHGDSASVWGTAGHPTQEAAEQRVLDACNAAMGGGCVQGEGWSGIGMIAVAVDSAGGIWIKGGRHTKEAGEWAAISHCVDGAPELAPCRITVSFSNPVIRRGVDGTLDYFPDAPVERRR